MKINDKFRDEKLQYDIDRKSAQLSGLSSDEADKYEEEILLPDQSRIIEQTKFT